MRSADTAGESTDFTARWGMRTIAAGTSTAIGDRSGKTGRKQGAIARMKKKEAEDTENRKQVTEK